jgi:outer membrane protein assembly factor BamB
VRRPLIALGAILLLLGAVVVAYILGLGPLARPTAARSVVFVAISRSTDEADAQEIEAVDLDAGTRMLFDVGSRITALALSADRRSLYVGLDGGKIALLDATTGSRFGDVDLGGPTVVSIVPTTDGKTLYAIAVTNLQSTVVPIDLATKTAADPIVLPTTAGPAVIRGNALVVPFGDPQRLQVAFIDVNTRVVTSRLTLPRGSLLPPAAFRISDTRTGIAAYDAGLGGGATGLRVYVLTDQLHWTDVALQAPFPQGPNRQIGIGLQVAATAGGAIHLCSIAGTAARRYVVGTDLKSTSAGTDCGPLSGGDRVLMAKRDPAQLLVLDDKTGKTVRTLPLAGVPARLVQ